MRYAGFVGILPGVCWGLVNSTTKIHSTYAQSVILVTFPAVQLGGLEFSEARSQALEIGNYLVVHLLFPHMNPSQLASEIPVGVVL
jgi:hypothetical protein